MHSINILINGIARQTKKETTNALLITYDSPDEFEVEQMVRVRMTRWVNHVRNTISR